MVVLIQSVSFICLIQVSSLYCKKCKLCSIQIFTKLGFLALIVISKVIVISIVINSKTVNSNLNGNRYFDRASIERNGC